MYNLKLFHKMIDIYTKHYLKSMFMYECVSHGVCHGSVGARSVQYVGV